jgi:hypothetical protein
MCYRRRFVFEYTVGVSRSESTYVIGRIRTGACDGVEVGMEGERLGGGDDGLEVVGVGAEDGICPWVGRKSAVRLQPILLILN